MPVGFESISDNGSIQITDNVVNLGFLRKGSVTQEDGFYSDSTYEWIVPTAAIPLDRNNEIPAISCSRNVSYLFYDNSRNSLIVGIDALYGENISVDYWVFGERSDSSSFGLQLFNDSGILSYDSSWQLMNVVGVLGSGGAISEPSGRDYAVLPTVANSSLNCTAVPPPPPPANQARWEFILEKSSDGIRKTSGQIQVNNFLASRIRRFTFITQSNPDVWNNPTSNNATTSYLVVDVTGL